MGMATQTPGESLLEASKERRDAEYERQLEEEIDQLIAELGIYMNAPEKP